MKRKRFVLGLMLAAAVCLSVGECVATYRPSFSPFALRRARWYVVAAPRFFRYCFVPVGTSESRIIRRFGKPVLAAESDSPEVRDHLRVFGAAGWYPRPPARLRGRVLIYEDREGLDGVNVYYYLDQRRRLKATFISET